MSAALQPIRVAIVEDDMDFLQALMQTVQEEPDLQLAGTASTQAAGLALLQGPAADILIVDLGLPDGSGIDVIRAAATQWPDCGTMVSTTFGDEAHVIRSIEAGAAGYLLKHREPARLAAEIRSLHSGGSPISPLIARHVLTRFWKAKPAVPEERSEDSEGKTSLSAREQEVLELITKGFTADEIAQLMHISRYTVLTFVRRIYKKLNVSSKAEAIYEAHAQGLLR
nr:response regulator transcription factor [uncultured Rhodoferax sp.]